MEGKKKIKCSYGILVILLFAVVCFLTDYILIDRKLNEGKGVIDCVSNSVVDKDDNENNDNTTKTYSYDDVAGYYTTSFDFDNPVKSEDANGNEINMPASFYLYLYNDGTFCYRYSYVTPYGTIGNYIIIDDKIILNDIYATGSDISLIPIDNTKTLIINSDNTLTDSNAPMYETTKVIEIVLNRSDSGNYENQFKYFRNFIEGY